MSEHLSKLFKDATPECVALYQSNRELYLEIFERGINAEVRRRRGSGTPGRLRTFKRKS